MAGRNKRLSRLFLLEESQRLRLDDWYRRNARYRTWAACLADIQERFASMPPTSLVARLPELTLPRVVQFPRMSRDYDLRFEWRGNCVRVAFSDLELKADPEKMIRWILEEAAPLKDEPCRHAGEKKRRYRDQGPMPVVFIADSAALDATACLETYVRCEDCGEELGNA